MAQSIKIKTRRTGIPSLFRSRTRIIQKSGRKSPQVRVNVRRRKA